VQKRKDIKEQGYRSGKDNTLWTFPLAWADLFKNMGREYWDLFTY
jgi:hypothetical protein